MSRARISAIDRLSRQSTYVSALESRPSWQTTGASLLSDGERHSIALDSQATGSRSSSRGAAAAAPDRRRSSSTRASTAPRGRSRR